MEEYVKKISRNATTSATVQRNLPADTVNLVCSDITSLLCRVHQRITRRIWWVAFYDDCSDLCFQSFLGWVTSGICI